MNVNATIETERLENVVVVENRAIEFDRSTGKAFVEKVIDDQTTERTEVTLGRRGGTVSQILDGVEAGDTIVIRQRSRREELQQAIQSD
jgi:multidrug efflux pump subunit AcrA (membrane-fusion protein)